MRQYANKLTELINNNNNDDANINIANTLSRLTDILNNPKLNKDVFEITQLLIEDSFKNNNEKNLWRQLIKEQNKKEKKDYNIFQNENTNKNITMKLGFLYVIERTKKDKTIIIYNKTYRLNDLCGGKIRLLFISLFIYRIIFFFYYNN